MKTLSALVQAVRDMPDQHEAYVRWADAWLADPHGRRLLGEQARAVQSGNGRN